MLLVKLFGKFKKHPIGYSFLIVVLASIVEQFNPSIFGLLKLNYVRFYASLIITVFTVQYFCPIKPKHKEDNHGES